MNKQTFIRHSQILIVIYVAIIGAIYFDAIDIDYLLILLLIATIYALTVAILRLKSQRKEKSL